MSNQSQRLQAFLSRPSQAVTGLGDNYVKERADLELFYGEECITLDTLRKLIPESARKALAASGERLEPGLADIVANAMKEWALSRGATHFTHWFQPLNGVTAEKHDSFLKITRDGRTLLEFEGEQLVKGETDGSSFPNGGIRTTAQARGYTLWDMSSPAFLRSTKAGKTLFIPTAFVSWTGEALDLKTPLLRSDEALSRQAVRVLHLLGDKHIKSVFSTLGPEQEFFVVDRAFFLARPDLVACGRTLIGAKPNKGQELEDHYFGKMPQRVANCLIEVEQELYKLGVPLKTRHNEVAPAQFEIAPIFESAVIATDHNNLLMDILAEVCEKHGLAVLFHEKPFAGINGSGKHNNWSMSTNTKENLLDPTKDPRSSKRFLLFLAAVLRACHVYSDLLRVAIAVPGNDYRLGANEAPPAIMSVYLGGELDELVRSFIPNKSPILTKVASKMSFGLKTLPVLPKDSTDRNRTSPFAFTGNKFEFRAVGSSQSCAVPISVVNTIVADALMNVADELEKTKEGKEREEAVTALVTKYFNDHYAIVFNGNNYSQDWIEEAALRGLPPSTTAPQAIKAYEQEKNIKVFSTHGVFSAIELRSRAAVTRENFMKREIIEANTVIQLLKTHVLPAALKYQVIVAGSYGATKQVLGDIPALSSQKDLLLKIVEHIAGVQKSIADLELALHDEHASTQEEIEKFDTYQPRIHNLVASARTHADVLETIVDDALWPIPKYSEMLHIY